MDSSTKVIQLSQNIADERDYLITIQNNLILPYSYQQCSSADIPN